MKVPELHPLPPISLLLGFAYSSVICPWDHSCFYHFYFHTSFSEVKITKVNSFFLFGYTCAACRILVPQPGIEPTPPVVEVQNLNHWATREFPGLILF